MWLQVAYGEVPAAMADDVEARRQELVEAVAGVDDAVMELFLEEAPVDGDTLAAGIRRATIARDFFPVFLGSAYKNVGVQLLLDGVSSYLPCPTEARRRALPRTMLTSALQQPGATRLRAYTHLSSGQWRASCEGTGGEHGARRGEQ